MSELVDNKEELIKELFLIIKNAQDMTENERCEKGDYKNIPSLKHPQTKSEQIISRILDILLDDCFIECEDEPILDEMCSIASQLDIDVNQPEVWEDLFKLADEYKNS